MEPFEYNEYGRGKYTKLKNNGWMIRDYDDNGELIYYEDSNGNWWWKELLQCPCPFENYFQ